MPAYPTTFTSPPHTQIAKLRAGDVTPDVMLGRQTLLNCAPFHNMSQGCDGARPAVVSRAIRLALGPQSVA